jgi:hypothetical protein
MNPDKQLTRFFIVVAFVLLLNDCQAQVVVNGKNLNVEKDLEYIQLMYYIDKSTFGPVFFIDFGFIEPEYSDIIEPERNRLQEISINGQDVTDRVTSVWILNQLHKAGWEYMGDAVYVPLRIMHNWHILTLKRKGS